MNDGNVTIWMNLLGFDRDDSDKGVKRFLAQTGFKPEAVCALLCHSDIFNLYKGMDEEYTLSADNCAYWGIPKNTERERQPWTNYDLRTLIKNLRDEGIEMYAGIFGTEQRNAFHNEWIYDHPEIRRHGTNGAEGASGIFCLKRFKDGSYYEDFFIDKVCEALTDYGFTGVHLADSFCPARGGMLHNLDFSTDYVEQFLEHTGITLPSEIAKTLGDDSAISEKLRSEWIYSNRRSEWVRFNAWRWNVFFKKIADRLHAIGKKLSIIGMYCTDPFETLYCNGIDLLGAVNSGVDRISANILPTSVYLAGGDDRPYFFHKYMAIAPTMAAYIPKGKIVTMLGLQDATEEWSVMHHAPTLHERDAYTVMSYRTIDEDGDRRAMEGYFLCLGDGIPREDWDKERVLLEKALSSKNSYAVSAMMLWSNAAHDAMLDEYIKTRRWTPHKYFYELAKAGESLAGTVRIDALSNYSGTLFVPNFDMLPESEQQVVLNYRKAPVICTAKSGFDMSSLGIAPTVFFEDKFSSIPMIAFAFGGELSCEEKEHIETLISVDDGRENLSDIKDCAEFDNTLFDTLVFSKVTRGFSDALAYLIGRLNSTPFEIDKPNMILKNSDGSYRIYLFNDSELHYHRAFVKVKGEIIDTKTITDFPVLPPRFMDAAGGKLQHSYNGFCGAKKSFEIKIKPGGVTVIDVYIK